MPRTSINVEGFGHGNLPIPAASRVGPLLMTGGIHGIDMIAGKAGDIDDQAERMFGNLSKILNAAGGGFESVVRMTIFVKVPEARAAVDNEWLKAFPDENSRPARHTLVNDHLPGGMLMQCDATAYMEDQN